MQRITSRKNPLVARFREVARGQVPDRMLLDGDHVVHDAVASGARIEVAAFADDAANGRFAEIAGKIRASKANVIAVSAEVLNAISPVQQPSGVVAIAERPRKTVDDAFELAPQLVVLLADVQDPGNVGAVIRTAEACGATGVVTSERTADPYGWKALRGAMGSTLRLPVASHQSLADALQYCRDRHVRVLALVPRGGTPLPDVDLRAPSAIVLGAEGHGLPPRILDMANDRVTIPMQAAVESLNVAVAAAIVLYEASRQRMERADVAVR